MLPAFTISASSLGRFATGLSFRNASTEYLVCNCLKLALFLYSVNIVSVNTSLGLPSPARRACSKEAVVAAKSPIAA